LTISVKFSVGCTNITDRQTTDRRQADETAYSERERREHEFTFANKNS